MHRNSQRFALLYRLLWRLREESRLLDIEVDEDVARARTMQRAIDRDIHKMHAYVRFREVATVEGPVYVAWFEPAHYIVEAAAPFFMRRFAAMRWSILTPHQSVFWDGEKLQFGPGAKRSDAPDSDALEALWKTYYASIFNPARLKIHTMQGHMPRKYWANLPEAALIPQLIGDASRRTLDMPDDSAAFKAAARKLGVKVGPRKTVFIVQGDDRPGAIAEICEKLASAGISMVAMDAASAGNGRYAGMFWVAPGDVRKATKVLGAA